VAQGHGLWDDEACAPEEMTVLVRKNLMDYKIGDFMINLYLNSKYTKIKLKPYYLCDICGGSHDGLLVVENTV
jgi:hypothetical protein